MQVDITAIIASARRIIEVANERIPRDDLRRDFVVEAATILKLCGEPARESR